MHHGFVLPKGLAISTRVSGLETDVMGKVPCIGTSSRNSIQGNGPVVLRYGIGTFRYGMGTFRYDMGTFRYGIGTFRYDMGTFRYGMGTFRYGMGTFRYGMGMCANRYKV